MNEEQFFYYLLSKTQKQFKLSPVRKYQLENNKNWNYAVCETPIQRGKPILFGLNWGGDNINTQSTYPELRKEKRDWNFHNNTKQYLKDYLNTSNIEEFNYSNLCFFRSPNTKYLNNEDWELSFHLFKEYVNYIEPKFLILLGSQGWAKLKSLGTVSNENKITYNGTRKRTFGYYADFMESYKIGCVPHPQAHISSQARKFIWENISKNIII